MNDLQPIDILLAKDSPADAEMTLRALRKKGIAEHVTWVKDGVEALEFLRCEGAYSQRRAIKPRLVMLDLKMPRLDGIEVLRQIKADERLKLIPVVMLTSSAEERDVAESYRLGVNSYLVKPVSFEDFVEQVADAGGYWAILNRVPEMT